VTLTAVGLEEVLVALAADPEAARAALARAFDRLAAPAPTAPEPPAPPRGVLQFGSLRLLAATPEMTSLIGADGAHIANLPFRVGRHADGAPLDLALVDERPYILSRQHFAIEMAADGLAVRDLGSHHGTIVNGTPIRGTEQEDAMVLLVAGANQIVAGMPESPFRFVLVVEPSG
jgi:pSer/pThr/pTyr-binding forkhead associated (FHA) protein